MKGAASFTWDGLQALAQAVREGDRARGTDPAVPRETPTGILPGWGRMRMSDGPENGSHGSDLRRHGTFSKKDTSRAA